jgi:cytochrome c oxidase accessory protein FixG
MCIVICPYGRLQSALSDDHTMTIGYDERRGEPRAKLGKRNQVLPSTQNAGLGERGQVLTLIQVAGDRPAAPAFGDCIACNRCVQVCPTGIDIRQGLQLECIGCANCIDACDAVMARLRKPAGLIRYDSQVGLAGGRTRWLRPRTIAYAVLLLVGATVATFAFSSVQPASLSVVRITGASYFVDAGTVRNQFFVRIVNKSPDAASFTVAVEAPGVPLNHTGVAGAITVPGLGENVVPLVALVDRARYSGPFRFTIRLRDATGVVNLQREVEFLGPDVQLLGDDDREKGIRR